MIISKLRGGLLCCLVLVLAASLACPLLAQPLNQGFELRGGLLYLNLKDADVKNVLQLFAKAMHTNIVTADGVDGKVTVAFTGIEPREGLEAVLRSNGLDWFESGGTIYVTGNKVMRTYYLQNARPSDIAETVKTILPEGSKISVDDSYNTLVVQTGSDSLMQLEKLIHELDIPPTQVLIEVKMIEVRHSNNGEAGLDASYTNPSDTNDVAQTTGFAGRSTDTGAQGLYAHVLQGGIEGYLSAIDTKATYNTIATPKVTTISNKEANLLIGSKLGYKVTVVTETTTTQDIKFLEIGTSLKLTPHVSRSGHIRMEVEPKISDGSVADDVPTENTTETKNEVVVKDGQTFVIGGLMKDKEVGTDYGIPFLMDIPYLGAFFRRTVITKEKQELLVFVTPHILNAAVMESMQDDISKMEKTSSDVHTGFIH